MRRSEQAVDHLIERLGRLILNESVDVDGIWQKPGQIEVGAPDQNALVAGWSRSQTLLIQSRLYEPIDWIGVPARIRILRNGWTNRFLKSPPGFWVSRL